MSKHQQNCTLKTQVINVKKQNLLLLGKKDFQECLNDPNFVYIGRRVVYVNGTFESKWRNPFPAKFFGRDECIEAYRQYIISKPELLQDLHELKGKVLGCWCKPDKCHGDVLIELINQYCS